MEIYCAVEWCYSYNKSSVWINERNQQLSKIEEKKFNLNYCAMITYCLKLQDFKSNYEFAKY